MLLALTAVALAGAGGPPGSTSTRGSPPLEPRAEGRRASLVQSDVHISPDELIAMVFECDTYPRDVATLGVRAVDSCVVLDRPTPDSVVIYERTGESLLFSRRQEVLWIRVVTRTETLLRLEWDLVHQSQTESGWEGAYAHALRPDAIRMPVSHGGWELDIPTHTVKYWIEVGLGGAVPGIFVSDDSLLGLTRAMLAGR